ncbi:MAG: alpha/beta hydrolase [Flavobacteriales bacterium]|nr:alpha/beta hydrolase [Flavobacteriales bacterium]
MKEILLLHGALASEEQMNPLAEKLSADFHVHAFSFSGHGGTPIISSEFSIEHFSNEITAFIAASGNEKMNVFGYSMGGYAAMLSSLSEPWWFENLITLGTKYDWNPESGALEMQLLNTEKMEQKIPLFVEQLKKTHDPTSWLEVVIATREMMRALGENPPLTPSALKFHEVHCLVLCGENDTTAPLEKTQQALANHHYAEVLMVPKTPHSFEKVNLDFLAEIITRYCHRQ